MGRLVADVLCVPMDKTLIAILAGGVIVMVGTCWWVAAPPPAPNLLESHRHFMHCAHCGRETRYEAKRAALDCPICGAKGPQVVTEESLKKTGGGQGPVWRIVPAVLIELTVLAAVVYGYTVFRTRKAGGEEPTYPLFCPQCHRKLRYRKSQGGRLGKCPSCRRPLVFPRAPEPVKRAWPARVWQKLMGSPRESQVAD